MFIRRLLILFCTLSIWACAASDEERSQSNPSPFLPETTTDFTFQSGDITLSGIFDTPSTQDAEALIIFVHGYGGTDVRDSNSFGAFSELRRHFNALGIATVVWDKPGQGRSEGVFDIDQSIYESAQEVVDAAAYLREVKAPGAKKIGIWGISRAGWIAPIAMSQDEDIDFWISVSGTSGEDNFNYLLLSNLPYEGGSEEQAALFEREWRAGCEVLRTKGSYDAYQKATASLRANEYIKRMRGEWPTKSEYESYQKTCEAGTCENMDNEMCSYVWVKDFDKLLSALDVDVLAIFGEKDLNIDWAKTSSLYSKTIGQNSKASLVVKTFADGDHTLTVSENGSLKEMNEKTVWKKVDGYYETQTDWLKEHVLDQRK